MGAGKRVFLGIVPSVSSGQNMPYIVMNNISDNADEATYSSGSGYMRRAEVPCLIAHTSTLEAIELYVLFKKNVENSIFSSEVGRVRIPSCTVSAFDSNVAEVFCTVEIWYSSNLGS